MSWLKKNINYLLSVGLVSCVASSVFSQITLEEGEFSIYGSFMYGKIWNKSFSTFADSYSAVNAAGLEKPMSGLKYGTGFTCGIRTLFGSINYMRLEGTAEAVFKNGDKRLVKNVITTPLNIGLPMIMGKVLIHPKFGLAQTTMNVSYQYPNGMKSVGNETLYSGQYYSYGMFFGLDLGFSQSIGKHHRIEAGLSANFIGGKRNQFTDYSHGRQMGAGYYPTSLPLDVAAYGESGEGYLTSEKGFVSPKSKTLSFFVTYSFILFKSKI